MYLKYLNDNVKMYCTSYGHDSSDVSIMKS